MNCLIILIVHTVMLIILWPIQDQIVHQLIPIFLPIQIVALILIIVLVDLVLVILLIIVDPVLLLLLLIIIIIIIIVDLILIIIVDLILTIIGDEIQERKQLYPTSLMQSFISIHLRYIYITLI